MCGIFGIYSSGISRSEEGLFNVLVHGLKRLEYRGYDSAGACVSMPEQGDDSCEPTIVKTVGKVQALSALLDHMKRSGQFKILPKIIPGQSLLGIAHTRWATHGTPSTKNCHPHSDNGGNFCVVHNGVITNHAVLKRFLIDEGYHFSSETDTEVIPILCHQIMSSATKTLSLPEIVMCMVSQLEGAFSLIITSKLFPGEMVACKRGSPLIFGLRPSVIGNDPLPAFVEVSQSLCFRGAHAIILSSDVCAILEHTNKVVYLQDEDVLHLASNNLKIISMANLALEVTRHVTNLSMKLEAITKGEYRFYMEKEIFEQAESLEQTMQGRVRNETQNCGPVVLGGMLEHMAELDQCNRILLIACGSSFHACLSSRDIMQTLTGKPVHCEVASDLLDRGTLLRPSDMCLFMSQSGETADTLQALRIAKQSGAFCVGVTNVVASTIARETDCGVHVNAGCEIGVASTKAYTSQVVVMVMIAMVMSRRNAPQTLLHQDVKRNLINLPSDVQQTLSLGGQIFKLALKLHKKNSVLIVGRGSNYATALEGALKLKEVSLIHSEGVLAGELKHGPLALIDNDLPVIIIATADTSLNKMHTVVEQLRSRNANLIVICHKTDRIIQGFRGPDCFLIEVPQTEASLQPIINVIPLQLLCFYIAVMRGLNVDQPRNLAKSVTVADH